jgi:Leucine-rich repeat (LRR) protein
LEQVWTFHRGNQRRRDVTPIFYGFKNLRALDLGGSQLTGQLPIWLSKLRNLKTLDLSFNRIVGSISSRLSTLPKLFRLNLSNNLISGEFPNELCSFPTVISPKAIRDDIYLYLPIFLVKNDSLLRYNFLLNMQPNINISNNKLSGNIPVEIGRLKQLRSLGLSNNNFSGNIPNQISELTNLEILDLSRNQLLGELPASLTSLHFLSQFIVANNNLQGPIPSSTQLQSFDASAYEGNPGLCGPPLPNGCADVVSSNVDNEYVKDDEDGLIGMTWFSISVVLGFITGFWGV